MNKTKCPVCSKVQNVYSKKDKIDMKCRIKSCGTLFSAERMGDKYKQDSKKK